MQNDHKNSAHDPSIAPPYEMEYLQEALKDKEKALKRSAGEWPFYHENSLFYAAALEVHHEFQVPIEMAMMTALGAISCVCQDMVDVKLPVGNITNPALMLLTIAKSGERKTTVQKQFFRVISEYNRRAIFIHQKKTLDYESKKNQWNEIEKEMKKAYKKAFRDENEELEKKLSERLDEHRKHHPKWPRSLRMLYADTTPQALVEAMHNNTPTACLMSSESNSIFSGHALKDLDKINTLWDGEDVIVDRSTRPSFILTDSRLTLSLMAQPVVVTRFLSKRGEEARGIGFLARFITVMAEEKAGTRDTRPIGSLENTKKFNQRIEELIRKNFDKKSNLTDEKESDGKDSGVENTLEIGHNKKTRKVLTFSSKASQKWIEYHKEIEGLQAPHKALSYYKDHASKLMENVSRMAVLLHIFEDTYGKKEHIDSDTLDFAYDFCRVASQHFLKHIAGTPTVVKDANDIVELLFLDYEKKQDALRETQPQENYSSHESERKPYTKFSNLSPDIGERGREHTFTLSLIKQYGPYALRGKAGHHRLIEAIDLLSRMGHMKNRRHGIWEISESLYSGPEGPEIRNGVDFTVDNLPLVSQQEYYYAQPGHSTVHDGWQIVENNKP